MSDKLKVLSVGHSYVVSMNRSILRELAQDDAFEVTVGAPRVFHGSLRSIDIEPEPEGSRLKVVPVDCRLTQKMHVFFYNGSQLSSLFSQKFDCAHFWEEPYIHAGYQLGKMAKKHRVPFLFRTAQSLIKNYIFPFSYFEKKTYDSAKQWIAGGNLVYQAMRDKGWKKPGQVVTLAVDTNAFKPFSLEQKLEFRNRNKLPGPLIGYLGRLSEEKGCNLFMQALSQLKDKPWSFLVMGSGPYREKILQWAKEEGLEDRIQVQLYTHEEVPQVLPACDLLLCPSQTRKFWKEQFGRMIVEAFASGVPVIGSDSGEIPKVIGEAGVVLPEADVEAWVKSIGEFLNDPMSFKGFVDKGLKRVHQFSAKAIAEQYKEVYRSLVGGMR